MGFFSAAPEPSGTYRVTLRGGPITYPEAIGDMFTRRMRLAYAAIQIIADYPVAQPEMVGTPLGDGVGMEPLVEILRPWFLSERSLIRWVGLRGSLLFADIAFADVDEWAKALAAMGFEADPDQIRLSDARNLSSQQQEACVGLLGSIAMKLNRFDEIENMSAYEVNQDPELSRVNESVALDYIVWVSVALLRTGRISHLMSVPEPGRIERPGWYPEPIFGKAERYHDGSDWTVDCRVVSGRNVERAEMPMS